MGRVILLIFSIPPCNHVCVGAVCFQSRTGRILIVSQIQHGTVRHKWFLGMPLSNWVFNRQIAWCHCQFPSVSRFKTWQQIKACAKTLCLHALPRYTIIVIFLRNDSCHNWVELFTFNCWKYIKYRHGQPTNLIYSKYVTYNNLMQLPPVLFKTVLFFVLCLVWGSCDSTKAIS